MLKTFFEGLTDFMPGAEIGRTVDSCEFQRALKASYLTCFGVRPEAVTSIPESAQEGEPAF